MSRASLVLLTKTDLLPFIRFNSAFFHNDVRRLNPSAVVVELSIINNHGMDTWTHWLDDTVVAARGAHVSNCDCGSEFFVG